MANRATNTLTRAKTTLTVKQTSPNAIRDPLVPEALMGNRRRWSSWQDWLNIGLGLYLILSPMWTPGAPTGVFFTLGLLTIAVAMWAGFTASSALAEFVQMGVGAATILSPLFHGYSAVSTNEATDITASAGTAIFVGAGLITLAAHAGHRNRSGRSATNPHDQGHP